MKVFLIRQVIIGPHAYVNKQIVFHFIYKMFSNCISLYLHDICLPLPRQIVAKRQFVCRYLITPSSMIFTYGMKCKRTPAQLEMR